MRKISSTRLEGTKCGGRFIKCLMEPEGTRLLYLGQTLKPRTHKHQEPLSVSYLCLLWNVWLIPLFLEKGWLCPYTHCTFNFFCLSEQPKLHQNLIAVLEPIWSLLKKTPIGPARSFLHPTSNPLWPVGQGHIWERQCCWVPTLVGKGVNWCEVRDTRKRTFGKHWGSARAI